MPKDTKKTGKSAKAEKPKKANPALEDDEVLEDEDTDTETDEEEVDETEDTDDDADADEDTDEADEADEEDEEAEDDDEVGEEPVKKPAKGSKGKGAKSKPEKVEDDEDIDEEVAPRRDAPKAKSRGGVEAEMLSDIEATKRKLAKQPKVRIFIPLGIGEKKGSKSAVETVTINGHRTVLPKGEYVTVPQGIADLIEQHYNMAPENTEMGERYRLDRPRFKDGMSTDEALS